MLHLARKAFFPAPLPFPLLHVDTTWKFRDMYAMRDARRRGAGVELIVHTNPDAVAQGINPFTHGSAVHTDVWKTQGLKQALDRTASTPRSAARGATRKSRAPRSASSRSARPPIAGTRRTSARSSGASTTRASTRARASACFRCRTGPSSTSGNTSAQEGIPVVPLYFAAPAAGGAARRRADHGRRRADAARARRDARSCARCASARSAAIR